MLLLHGKEKFHFKLQNLSEKFIRFGYCGVQVEKQKSEIGLGERVASFSNLEILSKEEREMRLISGDLNIIFRVP